MTKYIKLSEYATLSGVKYLAAYKWFRKNQIPGAIQRETGTIYVPVSDDSAKSAESKEERVVTYSRVSNQSRKSELQYQVKRCTEFANAKGLVVHQTFYEVASGMNDSRKKLWEMIESNPTTIIVENKDRLTRFGFEYLSRLLKSKGCSIIVMNTEECDEQDLMEDMIAIVTSFCCRLYGLRRMKNKLDKIKAVINED